MPYVREYGVLSANATADVDRQKSRSWTDIMATLLAAGVKLCNELHIPRLELDSRKYTRPKYYVRSTPYIFCMYSVCCWGNAWTWSTEYGVTCIMKRCQVSIYLS